MLSNLRRLVELRDNKETFVIDVIIVISRQSCVSHLFVCGWEELWALEPATFEIFCVIFSCCFVCFVFLFFQSGCRLSAVLALSPSFHSSLSTPDRLCLNIYIDTYNSFLWANALVSHFWKYSCLWFSISQGLTRTHKHILSLCVFYPFHIPEKYFVITNVLILSRRRC